MNIIRAITAKHLGPRIVEKNKPVILGICLHDTAGSGTHNDTKYLAAPSDGRVVSVDFTAERDGSVYQLNPDLRKNCTWHCGRSTKFHWNGQDYRNRQATQVLIGIEIVQSAKLALSPIWPPEQVKAVAELCFSLCKEFGLTKDQITTHQRIITDGSRTDPRKFPFDQFWFRFNQIGGAIPADGDLDKPHDATKADPVTNNIVHTVKDGDTLWAIANRYHTSVEKLKAQNGIETASNLIVPGQKLIIKK